MSNASDSRKRYKSSAQSQQQHIPTTNKPINMFTKCVLFFGMVAAASAIAVPFVPVAKVAYAEQEAPAHYEFQYSVHDEQSGDVKQQQESRAGDAVHGSYSLVQPDGVHRIVEYTADNEHGFNANVRYEGQPIAAPAPAKIAYAAPAKIAYAAPITKVAYSAPVAYAAPVVKAYSAPLAYTAPVTKVAYAAPVAKFAYAAPVAKVHYASAPVAKVAYEGSLGHVTFSSPAVSYSH
ncbi:cuticle protein 8-like [Vanessa tameamea]|uniref:Cuticle protein 8-like n=1 Tax=Vanessa tameamea TaxID=334116 RepID=A0A8B8IAZ1_VANTA